MQIQYSFEFRRIFAIAYGSLCRLEVEQRTTEFIRGCAALRQQQEDGRGRAEFIIDATSTVEPSSSAFSVFAPTEPIAKSYLFAVVVPVTGVRPDAVAEEHNHYHDASWFLGDSSSHFPMFGPTRLQHAPGVVQLIYPSSLDPPRTTDVSTSTPSAVVAVASLNPGVPTEGIVCPGCARAFPQRDRAYRAHVRECSQLLSACANEAVRDDLPEDSSPCANNIVSNDLPEDLSSHAAAKPTTCARPDPVVCTHSQIGTPQARRQGWSFLREWVYGMMAFSFKPAADDSSGGAPASVATQGTHGLVLGPPPLPQVHDDRAQRAPTSASATKIGRRPKKKKPRASTPVSQEAADAPWIRCCDQIRVLMKQFTDGTAKLAADDDRRRLTLLYDHAQQLAGVLRSSDVFKGWRKSVNSFWTSLFARVGGGQGVSDDRTGDEYFAMVGSLVKLLLVAPYMKFLVPSSYRAFQRRHAQYHTLLAQVHNYRSLVADPELAVGAGGCANLPDALRAKLLSRPGGKSKARKSADESEWQRMRSFWEREFLFTDRGKDEEVWSWALQGTWLWDLAAGHRLCFLTADVTIRDSDGEGVAVRPNNGLTWEDCRRRFLESILRDHPALKAIALRMHQESVEHDSSWLADIRAAMKDCKDGFWKVRFFQLESPEKPLDGIAVISVDQYLGLKVTPITGNLVRDFCALTIQVVFVQSACEPYPPRLHAIAHVFDTLADLAVVDTSCRLRRPRPAGVKLLNLGLIGEGVAFLSHTVDTWTHGPAFQSVIAGWGKLAWQLTCRAREEQCNLFCDDWMRTMPASLNASVGGGVVDWRSVLASAVTPRARKSGSPVSETYAELTGRIYDARRQSNGLFEPGPPEGWVCDVPCRKKSRHVASTAVIHAESASPVAAHPLPASAAHPVLMALCSDVDYSMAHSQLISPALHVRDALVNDEPLGADVMDWLLSAARWPRGVVISRALPLDTASQLRTELYLAGTSEWKDLKRIVVPCSRPFFALTIYERCDHGLEQGTDQAVPSSWIAYFVPAGPHSPTDRDMSTAIAQSHRFCAELLTMYRPGDRIDLSQESRTIHCAADSRSVRENDITLCAIANAVCILGQPDSLHAMKTPLFCAADVCAFRQRLGRNLADALNQVHSSLVDCGRALPGTSGLANLVNSCYMNATLQVVSRLRPFIELSPVWSVVGWAAHESPLAAAFWGLVSVMGTQDNHAIHACNEKFHEQVRLASYFASGDMHCAAEFLVFLLNALCCEPQPHWCARDGRKRVVLSDYFHSLSTNCRHCLSCQRDVSVSVEPTAHLMLQLPQCEGVVPLVKLLQAWRTSLCDDAGPTWLCSHCRQRTVFQARSELVTFADVLVFEIKRYSFRAAASVVNTTALSVPLALDAHCLSTIMSADVDCQYTLRGVIDYHHDPVKHYTALVPSPESAPRSNQSSAQSWLRLDDKREPQRTRIRGADWTSKNCYLLFYERAPDATDQSSAHLHRIRRQMTALSTIAATAPTSATAAPTNTTTGAHFVSSPSSSAPVTPSATPAPSSALPPSAPPMGAPLSSPSSSAPSICSSSVTSVTAVTSRGGRARRRPTARRST